MSMHIIPGYIGRVTRKVTLVISNHQRVRTYYTWVESFYLIELAVVVEVEGDTVGTALAFQIPVGIAKEL